MARLFEDLKDMVLTNYRARGCFIRFIKMGLGDIFLLAFVNDAGILHSTCYIDIYKIF
jgi:hypothetical protein